jgi:tetratricopeptide (TPR) repeat protein
MMRHLSRRRVSAVLAVLLAVLIQSGPSAAWGPQTRQAIAIAASNLVRHSFTAGEVMYEGDILRGASDGIAALGGDFPLDNDDQAVDAVALQIIILREAIRNGPGSYAAYRLGGLSALVSELMVPYGLVYDESERELADRIQQDVEARMSDFAVSPPKPTFEYIMNHRLYFKGKRQFIEADKVLLADDYKRGKDPKGLWVAAGKKYFVRSIDAVTDVWYTVLHIEPGTRDYRPSNRQMARYYVSEVKYLLGVKKNIKFAERAYDLFEKYNPGLPMSLVEIGDAFYNFGTPQGKERGVEEWIKAYGIPGESRPAASVRLSKHYIEEGEQLYKRAQTPEGKDTDLPDALKAFTRALEFDLANTVAANNVTETTKAIGARADLFKAQQQYLERVDGMVKKAEGSAIEKDYGAALSSYSQALNVLGLVTVDFKELNAKARDETSKITQAVKQAISDVYASANDSIEKGDTALLNGNVDEAVRAYSMVKSIVAVVPDEAGSLNAQKKKDMEIAAQNKIDEAEIQRKKLAQPKPQALGGPTAAPPKKP